jgi:hypothetical protein
LKEEAYSHTAATLLFYELKGFRDIRRKALKLCPELEFRLPDTQDKVQCKAQ